MMKTGFATNVITTTEKKKMKNNTYHELSDEYIENVEDALFWEECQRCRQECYSLGNEKKLR